MSPSKPPIVDPEKLNEEISAYLDGELPGDDCREVEERLASDSKFRGRLQEFERAWHLLDELPRAEADDRFAATTVEMVAVSTAQELAERQRQWPRQYLRGWLLSAAAVTAALLLGFGVVSVGAALLARSGLLSSPDDQLLADVGVLLNLDRYQQVESLVYLKKLDESGLFAEPLAPLDSEGEPQSLPGAAPADPSQRRSFVAALGGGEKKELHERQQRFAALQPEAQERLRAFDRELAADPDAGRLREVLSEYGQWLTTQPADQRARLRTAPLDERIAQVRRLRAQDERKYARLQAAGDLRKVFQWAASIAERNEARLVTELPERARRELPTAGGLERRRWLLTALAQQWQRNGFGRDPEVSPAAFDELKSRLSPGVRERMDKADGMAAQWETLIDGLAAEVKPSLSPEARRRLESAHTAQDQWPVLMRAIAEARPGRRGAVSNDELWRFFDQDLSEEERDRLKNLPRDEVVQQLRARYQRSRMRDRGDGPPPREFGPRGKRGEEFHPHPPHDRPPRRGPGGEEFRSPPRGFPPPPPGD